MPEAKKVADIIAAETGFDVEPMVPTSNAAIIKGMHSDEIQLAYLPAWAFLKAHHTADAQLLVVEERDGSPSFDSHWYVRADGKIDKLADLEGKKVAFTVPTSAGGFLFPYSKLISDGIVKQGEDLNEFFKSVVFAGGYAPALKSLVEGKADAAAATDFAVKQYLSEEDQKKVRVLSTQGPVPTHCFGVRAEVPLDAQTKLKEALLTLNKPENQKLLEKVYGAQKLVARSHGDHLMGLQEAQETVSTDYPL
jgi:phosphonate transport system substrate-binding protein